MVKRKKAIIMSSIVLGLTTCFILLNSSLFIGSIDKNGETYLELNYTNQPNVDEIKAIISDASGMKKDSINVENSNGKLDIKFDAVEMEMVDSIESILNENFGDSISIISTSIIGKPTRTFAYYIIIIVTAILFLVSILVIAINSTQLLKERISRA